MLRTVCLYGEAAEKFGPMFRLDVDSAKEAVHALSMMLEGFRKYVVDHDFHIVKGLTFDGGKDLGEDEIGYGLGENDLHIYPVLEGSGGGDGKGKAGLKIVAGLLLVGIALFAPAAALAAVGLEANTLLMAGVGMAITGVSQLLVTNDEKEEDDSSSYISGSIGMARHGDVIPVIYGRAMVRKPKAVSFALSTDDVANVVSSDGTDASGFPSDEEFDETDWINNPP